MNKAKPPYVEIPISCPHCQVKQVVRVRARTGFAQMAQQAVVCVKCQREFNVTVPDEIVSGPFLERYSKEWLKELERLTEAGQQLLANPTDARLMQQLVESGSRLGWVIPID